MESLEEILEAARRLSEGERQRLIEELGGQGPDIAPDIASDERRKAAMRDWRSRAGTGHSDFTDISENKNRYLAEIYATKP